MDWASHTFGHANLGDPRRVERLCKMAAAAVLRPGGTVTSVMQIPAEREGAFRFLESSHVDTQALADAAFETTAGDAAELEGHVFVAIDQTDLTFTDRTWGRGLGPDAKRNSSIFRSVQVMNALAIDSKGTVLGVVDQQWWNRPEEKTPWGKGDPRPPEKRESWEWVRCFDACLDRFKSVARHMRLWFLMDRAADFHGTLSRAAQQDVWVTIRSNFDRRIYRHGRAQWLWKTLSRRPILGHVEICVPRGHGRKRRRARFEVRALCAETRVRDKPRPQVWAQMTCVQIREVSPVPRGETPIAWRLLSNYPVEDLSDALCVVRSYTQRWKVEEFHKTWKSGTCDVESSQLRSFDAIRRWATILATVAARTERLKQLSRQQPDLDAHTEFTREELDAAILLSETSKFEVGDKMTLVQAVRLIAMIGGHMGRKGDGPPGSITIRRGLSEVIPAAKVLNRARTSG